MDKDIDPIHLYSQKVFQRNEIKLSLWYWSPSWLGAGGRDW